MKIIKDPNNQIICQYCHAILEWEENDLRWTHSEPDYYYVKCPCCGASIWMKKNGKLNEIYDRLHNKPNILLA